MSTEKRLPDAEGWWARHRGGRVEWFYVHVLSDGPVSIWISDIEDFAPATAFTSPLTRWYGPVDVPWSEDVKKQ
jgi:hypothetical protein